MNTINTSSISLYVTQQSSQKELVKSEEKTVEVSASSVSIETKEEYDFENITPYETYELADKLYQSGEIDVYQVATLMIIGFQQEFNTRNQPIDTNKRDNDPFNLYDELHKKALNSFDNKSFTNPDIQNSATSLIELLLSLPQESLFIKYSSIDIKV
jgi:hypothetical protein